jgi:energy-coupling factor transporter ATP-binding protein EcfA2
MDEPMTGLHFDDIEKLLAVLHKLVHAGNTLVVVEHNQDVITLGLTPALLDRAGQLFRIMYGNAD